MKKYMGAICSIIVGIATFVFLSIPCRVYTLTIGSSSSSDTSNAWSILSEDLSTDGYSLFKIFTIIMIVFAVICLLVGILLWLQNAKALKVKANLGLANAVCLILYSICALIAFIGMIVMCKKLSASGLGGSSTYSTGIGMWLNIGFGLVASLLAVLFSSSTKKKRR